MLPATPLSYTFAFLLATAIWAAPAQSQGTVPVSAASAYVTAPLGGYVSPSSARPVVADTLYNQLDGFGSDAGYFLSENFEARYDGIDSYLADEFAVPEDTIWSVTRVEVNHFYSVLSGGSYTPAPHFNVIIWEDDGGKPGAEAYRADSVASSSEPPAGAVSLARLSIDLPEAAELSNGTYWLTVQANLDITTNGTRYLWYNRRNIDSFTAQLFNYGGEIPSEEINSCNEDWGPINGPECGRNGEGAPSLTFAILGTATAVVVSAEDGAAPAAFVLRPAYPNPVAGSASIAYELPHAATVTLEVYDALGRRVATLAEGAKAAGRHAARWDAAGLPAGLYLYRLRAGDYTQTRKAVVAR